MSHNPIDLQSLPSPQPDSRPVPRNVVVRVSMPREVFSEYAAFARAHGRTPHALMHEALMRSARRYLRRNRG